MIHQECTYPHYCVWCTFQCNWFDGWLSTSRSNRSAFCGSGLKRISNWIQIAPCDSPNRHLKGWEMIKCPLFNHSLHFSRRFELPTINNQRQRLLCLAWWEICNAKLRAWVLRTFFQNVIKPESLEIWSWKVCVKGIFWNAHKKRTFFCGLGCWFGDWRSVILSIGSNSSSYRSTPCLPTTGLNPASLCRLRNIGLWIRASVGTRSPLCAKVSLVAALH